MPAYSSVNQMPSKCSTDKPVPYSKLKTADAHAPNAEHSILNLFGGLVIPWTPPAHEPGSVYGVTHKSSEVAPPGPPGRETDGIKTPLPAPPACNNLRRHLCYTQFEYGMLIYLLITLGDNK